MARNKAGGSIQISEDSGLLQSTVCITPCEIQNTLQNQNNIYIVIIDM